MNRAFFIGFGLAVWFLATFAFRVAGDVFFVYDDNLVMLVLYALSAVALIAIPLYLFRQHRLPRRQWIEAATLMVLPGMILDAGVSHFFADLMPNMDAAADGRFAGWLLWSYAMPLVAALLPVGSSFDKLQADDE